MKFNGVNLTEEQEFVIDCILTSEDTKIQAPAGSGKTFVLEAAASQIPRKKGLYLAFNKAIADSASNKFGNNVECRTGHSLAYRQVGKNYSHRFGKITGKLICQLLGITNPSPFPTISGRGYLILDTIKNFCYSNDPAITYRVVPKLKGNFPSSLAHKETQRIIATDASLLWDQMVDLDSTIPVTHDFYLKLWALSSPQIEKDFILFDEAQDANPVILGLLKRQKHLQKIYVGDQYQQIYSWRGAINAMQRIPTTYSPCLTQSFRFGPAIAELASDILTSYLPTDSQPLRIKGFNERDSKVEYNKVNNPNAVICRTNNGVILNIFKYLDQDQRVYVQGGTKQTETLLKGAQELIDGRTTWVPDLALFRNWNEVLEYAGTDSGSDLRGLVSLINNHGIPELLMILNQTQQSPKGADVILTTGHKAKGLEYSKVRMFSDFTGMEKTEGGDIIPIPPSEVNLLYVAATRALDVVDVSACAPCFPEEFKKSNDFFGRTGTSTKIICQKPNSLPKIII